MSTEKWCLGAKIVYFYCRGKKKSFLCILQVEKQLACIYVQVATGKTSPGVNIEEECVRKMSGMRAMIATPPLDKAPAQIKNTLGFGRKLAECSLGDVESSKLAVLLGASVNHTKNDASLGAFSSDTDPLTASRAPAGTAHLLLVQGDDQIAL